MQLPCLGMEPVFVPLARTLEERGTGEEVMTRWGYAAIAVVAALFVAAVCLHTGFADRLPDKVPTHWNLRGEVDGWTTKDNTFLIFYLMPTVTAGLVALGVFVL